MKQPVKKFALITSECFSAVLFFKFQFPKNFLKNQRCFMS